MSNKVVKALGERELLGDYRWTVFEERFELPDGSQHIRRSVRHPGAVVVLPISSSGNIVLVNQYRHPVRDWVLELPAGTLEHKEEPLLCAQRELQEEAGYAAEKWESLGLLIPTPGFCSEIQHGFLARGLRPSKLQGDEDELMDVVELSPTEVKERIAGGGIVDCKSIALICRAFFLDLL